MLLKILQLLKSAYWNGHLKAEEEAVAHLNALLDDFDLADDEKGIF